MENFSCYFLTAKVQITVIEIWTVLTARHKMMYDLTCMGRNSIKRVYLEKKWWLAWKKKDGLYQNPRSTFVHTSSVIHHFYQKKNLCPIIIWGYGSADTYAYNKNELILYCNLQNYRKESLKQVNTKLNISSNQEIYFGKIMQRIPC